VSELSEDYRHRGSLSARTGLTTEDRERPLTAEALGVLLWRRSDVERAREIGRTDAT
jgi:hypothetical protein